MLLQWTKLLSGIETVHKKFGELADFDERFHLLTLENCFKTQTIVELFFHTVPLIISQAISNEQTKWSAIAKITMIALIVMLVKNLSLLTVFVIRKFIDLSQDPPMRPKTSSTMMTKHEAEAFQHIRSYLIDPHDDGVDKEGNTTVHQLIL
jgi:hypothetical protein